MRKPRLMTPGPAKVPEDVLLELARPVIHHRSAEAKQVIVEVTDGLKEVFQTQNDVLILTASGTGAMEAAAVNTVPPGGKALVLSAGYFAARWGNICKAYGINAVMLETEWGQPVDPEQVAQALRQHPDTVCVMGTLSETSTGTGHPVEAIGRVVAADAGRLRRRRHLGRRRHGVPDRRVGHRPALRRLAEGPHAPARAWPSWRSAPRPGRRSTPSTSHSFYFNLKAARKKAKEFDTPVHAGAHADPGPARLPAADQGGGDREHLAAASPDERGLPGGRAGPGTGALQRPARRGADRLPRSRGTEGLRRSGTS